MSASAQSIFDQRESAARGYCRRFDAVFSQAQGSRLHDEQGRTWLDFLAGCGSLNYGHNDPDMAEALVRHIRRNGLSVAMDLHTDAKRQFLQAFVTHVLAPRHLPHRVQFTGPTGANAVEAALKLARKVTGRHNVIAFTNGYHGVSMGALAATANRYNRMGLPLHGVTRLPYDGYHGDAVDCASLAERMLEDPSGGVDPPAAVLLELVQGEGGLNTASAAWARRIAALARRHGALLIVDDVQAGCGRTGSFFSFEPLEIEPDLVVLSKSISGFGLPMALVLVRREFDQWQPGEHNGTFRGNTHAFVTATVAIEKFWARPGFESGIAERGRIVGQALQEMAALVPGARVKGRGMMQGLCVRDGEWAGRVSKKAYELGLVIETAGPSDEVLKVLAPITIDLHDLHAGLGLLRQALEWVLQASPAPSLLPERTTAATAG